MAELSLLEEIKDLRTVWTHEANWLGTNNK